jgi:uncharacterized protein YoxC
MEKLNLFFSKIRELTFWQRLFAWRQVRDLSYDAFEEFKSVQKEVSNKNNDYDLLERNLLQITTQNEGLENNIQQYERALNQKDEVMNSLNDKIAGLNNIVSKLSLANSKFETKEEQRTGAYENRITQLNQLKTTLEKKTKR